MKLCRFAALLVLVFSVVVGGVSFAANRDSTMYTAGVNTNRTMTPIVLLRHLAIAYTDSMAMPAATTTSDVVRLLPIPDNFRILSMEIQCADIDSGGSERAQWSIGLGSYAGRFDTTETLCTSGDQKWDYHSAGTVPTALTVVETTEDSFVRLELTRIGAIAAGTTYIEVKIVGEFFP